MQGVRLRIFIAAAPLLATTFGCEVLAGIGDRKIAPRLEEAGTGDAKAGVCDVVGFSDAASASTFLGISLAFEDGNRTWNTLWQEFAGGELRQNAVSEASNALLYPGDRRVTLPGAYGFATLQAIPGTGALAVVYVEDPEGASRLRVGLLRAGNELAPPPASILQQPSTDTRLAVGSVAVASSSDGSSPAIAVTTQESSLKAAPAWLTLFDRAGQQLRTKSIASDANGAAASWSTDNRLIGVALIEDTKGRVALFDDALAEAGGYSFYEEAAKATAQLPLSAPTLVAVGDRFVIAFSDLNEKDGHPEIQLASMVVATGDDMRRQRVISDNAQTKLLPRLQVHESKIALTWLEHVEGTSYKLMLRRYTPLLEPVEPPFCVSCPVAERALLAPYGFASADAKSYAVAFATDAPRPQLARIQCGR